MTADASQALVMRMCRYPADGVAWVWGHLFERGRVFAFTQHDVPCSVRDTPLDEAAVIYAIEAPHCRLRVERQGLVGAVRDAWAKGAFEMHDSRHAPLGAGPILVEIDALFTPRAPAVSNLDGRSEVLGIAQAKVTIGTRTWALEGTSQFHEQVQTRPRFDTPFTYATLRGETAGTVFIRNASGVRGHWIESNQATRIERIELSPPGATRTIILHGGDRSRTGVLRTAYDYTIPIGAGIRPGTVVTGEIDGVQVAGCVNDFLPDQLRYDRV
ncbi:MAG: hypothetical protein HC809_13345 [Gammaproteobacteria bacterium]|nr:hypothetical protein [Gammaproteobacteria bacterium]